MSLYDELDYPGHAIRETHPDHIGGIALLHGVTPPAVETCRVLELGCGDGANLVPMAYGLPRATFVGIDIAGRPVERGRDMIATLGLGNVRLDAMDLRDLDGTAGNFDFIIAHGLYSWVPAAVRERLLALCGALLAPDGVAFISHLALPGTHLRNVLRDAMRHFDDRHAPPLDRVRRAREVAGWLRGATGSEAYRSFARSLAEELDDVADGALFHDYLADDNEAVYITEFAERAERHGLQYLCDAEFPSTRWEHDPSLRPVRARIEEAGERSVLEREFLMDVLRCRRFRQTLLCRSEVHVGAPAPARLRGVAISSPLRPVRPADAGSRAPVKFRSPAGATLEIDHPAAKTALLVLGESWPRAMPWDALMAEVERRCGTAAEERVVQEVLFACVGADFADVHAAPPALVTRAGEHPRASAVARWEIERRPIVTTLRHNNLRIGDGEGATLLRALDGTRDRTALKNVMAEASGGDEARAARREGGFDRRLETALAELGRAGLLEA